MKSLEQFKAAYPEIQVTMQYGNAETHVTLRGEREITGTLVQLPGEPVRGGGLMLPTGLLRLKYATELWVLAALTMTPQPPTPLPFAEDLGPAPAPVWEQLGPLKVFGGECLVQAGLITLEGRQVHASLINQVEWFHFLESGRQNPYLHVSGVTLAAHDTWLGLEDRASLRQARGWTPEQCRELERELEKHWALDATRLQEVAALVHEPRRTAHERSRALCLYPHGVSGDFWDTPGAGRTRACPRQRVAAHTRTSIHSKA